MDFALKSRSIVFLAVTFAIYFSFILTSLSSPVQYDSITSAEGFRHWRSGDSLRSTSIRYLHVMLNISYNNIASERRAGQQANIAESGVGNAG
jgi:hypothetical protein